MKTLHEKLLATYQYKKKILTEKIWQKSRGSVFLTTWINKVSKTHLNNTDRHISKQTSTRNRKCNVLYERETSPDSVKI